MCALKSQHNEVKVAIPVYLCSRSLLGDRHQSSIDAKGPSTDGILDVCVLWHIAWWDSCKFDRSAVISWITPEGQKSNVVSSVLYDLKKSNKYTMTPDIVSIPSVFTSGARYYVDILAAESSDFESDCEGWERGEGVPAGKGMTKHGKPLGAFISPVTILNWAEYRSPECCMYCYNPTTGSVWEKPKGAFVEGDDPTKNQRQVIYVACIGADFMEELLFWREVFPQWCSCQDGRDFGFQAEMRRAVRVQRVMEEDRQRTKNFVIVSAPCRLPQRLRSSDLKIVTNLVQPRPGSGIEYDCRTTSIGNVDKRIVERFP
ncbi:hypothetical protein BDM02DRAFT_3132363 [Thelephora ganbajun]|uniref:Uncharacterized protein n=1 Tax=Thelephora ganbajun TaxID=370292 RepID=A0ACB6Z1Y9_THEGA|nr:hypothetical protein BDM02DRAFT_3132363 [Thelephora ganbajun]